MSLSLCTSAQSLSIDICATCGELIECCECGDKSTGYGSCAGGFWHPGTGEYICPPQDSPCDCTLDDCICIPVIPVPTSFDPNDILGPAGYGPEQWVSVKDRLGYMIRFENDAALATGPAQKVYVELPIHEHLDPFSLQLHGFGFGPYHLEVPSAPAFHSGRMEETADSLGVYVDITAGLDVVNRKAYWILQSIDPATGLPPLDPFMGFLPVNDTTLADTIARPGEGFVTFSLKPITSAATGDTATAQASIVFDLNEAIITNEWVNMIDAVAPESELEPLPPFTEEMSLPIHWSAADDPGGVGLKEVDLYASRDGGPFYEVAAHIQSGFYVFEGDTGSSYSFYTIASDHVRNREPVKPGMGPVLFGAVTSARFDVRAILQGPWNGVEMSTALNPLLPLSDPYSLNETVTSIPPDVVDWVQLQVRSATDSTEIIAQRACLLRKDGVVLDKDGQPGVQFEGLAETEGYLVVRHRNHLGVMTASPLQLRTLGQVVDFTSSATPAYGIEARKNDGGTMVLWCGDVVRDGVLKYTGEANDRDPILLKIGGVVPTSTVTGYHVEDVNLDGVVKYTGENNDRDPILQNIGGVVPTSIRIGQVP